MDQEIRLLRSQKELLETRLSLVNTRRRSDGIVRIAETFLNRGGQIGIWVIALLIAKEIAGKVTIANISISLPDNPLATLAANVGETVAYCVAVVSVIYGWFQRRRASRERKLRQEKTEYLQNRNRELELLIDPERTSSNLTPTGETNPEDL